MNQEILEKTEKLMQSIGIPTPPRLLMDVEEETRKEDPDFGVISDLLSQDVGMSAKIIKVCNSPYFGLRQKVDNVNKALSFLGLKNFKNVILASALRENMVGGNISTKNFDYFCNHSLFIAKIAQTIAQRLPSEIEVQIDPNHAYMAGLFHDCAIPLLSKKYKDYFKQIPEALKTNPSIVDIEEELYQTNHCIAAYFVAKSWHLPESICLAIKNHHTKDVSTVDDPQTKKLLAVLVLAESIIYYKDKDMTYTFDVFNYNIGEENYKNLMSALDFLEDEIADIEESVDKILDAAAEM